MVWPIMISAVTNGWDGSICFFEEICEGYLDVDGAFNEALDRKESRRALFAGCEIEGITPLGQRIYRTIDPDTLQLIGGS